VSTTKYRAPAGFQGLGLFIGGGFFPVTPEGILEVPAEGNYSLALPDWTLVVAPDTTVADPSYVPVADVPATDQTT
jgi:hypothetical protein